MRSLLAVLASLSLAVGVQAQNGSLTYSFWGANNNGGMATLNGGSSYGSLDFITPVSFSGVHYDPMPNAFNTSHWPSRNRPRLDKYYSLGFQTQEALQFSTINVQMLSSCDGPTVVELRSSLDNFATKIDYIKLDPGCVSEGLFSLPQATFGNVPAYTNVEFRFYGYSAANSGTNSELAFVTLDKYDQGAISIPFTAPVPEAGAWSVLGLFILSAIGWYWKIWA